MKVSCTQENLSKGVGTVSRVVGIRGTLPILSHILLSTEKGRLKVAGTDLEIGIVSYIGAKVDEEGSITVPARLLAEFVAANPDKTINLEVEGTKIKASSDHVTAHLHGLSANDFPLIPELKSQDVMKVKSSDFKEAIGQVAFAAAADETRPILTGVCMKVTSDTMVIAATDSYRLAERTLPLLAPVATPVTVIIPARTLQEVARLLQGDESEIDIATSSNQISFSFGTTTVVSRVLEGVFPDYEQIIPKTHTTTIQVDVGHLQTALKLGSTFARDVSNNIRLTFEEGQPMNVIATSPQVGDSTARVEAEVTGDTLEIAFNAKFLLDVLQASQARQVTLFCNGKLSPAIIVPKEATNYRALVMPLRLDES